MYGVTDEEEEEEEEEEEDWTVAWEEDGEKAGVSTATPAETCSCFNHI